MQMFASDVVWYKLGLFRDCMILSVMIIIPLFLYITVGGGTVGGGGLTWVSLPRKAKPLENRFEIDKWVIW